MYIDGERKKLKQPKYSEAIADIKKMLLATHDIKQTKKGYKYTGVEIEHNSVLVTSPSIKDRVKASGVRLREEQNEDFLDIILGCAFALGYSSAKIDTDNDKPFNFIFELGASAIHKLNEQFDGKQLEPEISEHGRTFELTKEQLKKFEEWRKANGKRYVGAIGGEYTFEFTPTSIGTIVSVSNDEKQLDLTDYDLF